MSQTIIAVSDTAMQCLPYPNFLHNIVEHDLDFLGQWFHHGFTHVLHVVFDAQIVE